MMENIRDMAHGAQLYFASAEGGDAQFANNIGALAAGHNAGQNTVGVAATYWDSAKTGTKPFTGAANPVEIFSSDGPRKIFYNPNGKAIIQVEIDDSSGAFFVSACQDATGTLIGCFLKVVGEPRGTGRRLPVQAYTAFALVLPEGWRKR